MPEREPKLPPEKAKKRPPTPQELVDIASEDSFPASDPPSRTVIKGVGPPPVDLGEEDKDDKKKIRTINRNLYRPLRLYAQGFLGAIVDVQWPWAVPTPEAQRPRYCRLMRLPCGLRSVTLVAFHVARRDHSRRKSRTASSAAQSGGYTPSRT